MSLFWSMYHSGAGAATDDTARRTASSALSKVEDLEGRCDKALLVCEALWTLLRDKFGVSEEELVNRVNEIDLSDGKLDGKVRRTAVSCAKCKRTVGRRFARCIYCGHPTQQTPFAAQ